MNTQTKAQAARDEQADAVARLKAMLPAGTKLYTVLRSVSPSGMSRRISVLIATTNDDGTPGIEEIDWLIQRAGIAKRRGNRDGLFIEGAGMDMGFRLAYQVSQRVHGDGYALSQSWV